MSIDKSLRQHYEVTAPRTKMVEGKRHNLAYITSKEAKLLQKTGAIKTKTPEGVFAYPGGAGTPGGYGGGPGDSSGGGGQGQGSPHRDTSATRAAQASIDASAAQARADALNTARENQARESAREKAIQTAALTTTTPTRSPHQVTKEQIEEQKQLDIEQDWKFQDLKAKEPTVPPKKYKTVPTRHPEVDDVVPTEIRDLYDPRGYEKKGIAATGTGRTWHEQAVKDAMPGFFDSGAGKLIKMVGLGLVAPHLLAGTKAGALLSAYNKYKGISKLASTFGFGPKRDTDLMSSLTGDIESIKEAFTGKPKDMSTFNELGLYTDRFPTDTTKQVRVGEDYRGVPISTAIAGGKGLQKGYEMLGIHPRDDINPELKALMAKGKSYSETDIIPPKHVDTSLAKFASDDLNATHGLLGEDPEFSRKVDAEVIRRENEYYLKGQEPPLGLGDRVRIEMWQEHKQNKIPKIFSEKLQEGVETYDEKVSESERRQQELLKEINLAHGGFIDKPLMGRSRDI